MENNREQSEEEDVEIESDDDNSEYSPALNEGHNNDILVPNGVQNEESGSSDDEIDDEEVEIPLQQPRGLPRLLVQQLFGNNITADDNSSESEEEEDDQERESFDSQLPSQHVYLGPGTQVGGRSLLDEDADILCLPLLNQPGLALLPGQLLPLHLFHPALVSMVRELVAGSGASRTFGVVSLGEEGASRGWAGTVGTTAEIFEYRDTEAEAGETNEVGLKLKARGRQRFRLLSTRRRVDGNLVGEVIMITDKELEDPLENIRLRSQDRLRNFPEDYYDNDSSPEDDHAKVNSCFSFLSSFGIGTKGPSTSNNNTNPTVVPVKLRNNFIRGKMTRHLSPLPPWVWDLYDPGCLADRIVKEFAKLKIGSCQPPSDPSELSWWVAANLPMGDELRAKLLELRCPTQRLRLELSFLDQCRVLVCRRCSKQLGEQSQIFSMSKEGPQGAFVNPGGHVHETLTLYRAKNLRLVGQPSTEYSWFPGYAWTIVECTGCWNHIGWKFTSSGIKKLNPEKFYGFSRRSLETKVALPAGDDDDAVEDSVLVM